MERERIGRAILRARGPLIALAVAVWGVVDPPCVAWAQEGEPATKSFELPISEKGVGPILLNREIPGMIGTGACLQQALRDWDVVQLEARPDSKSPGSREVLLSLERLNEDGRTDSIAGVRIPARIESLDKKFFLEVRNKALLSSPDAKFVAILICRDEAKTGRCGDKKFLNLNEISRQHIAFSSEEDPTTYQPEDLVYFASVGVLKGSTLMVFNGYRFFPEREAAFLHAAIALGLEKRSVTQILNTKARSLVDTLNSLPVRFGLTSSLIPAALTFGQQMLPAKSGEEVVTLDVPALPESCWSPAMKVVVDERRAAREQQRTGR